MVFLLIHKEKNENSHIHIRVLDFEMCIFISPTLVFVVSLSGHQRLQEHTIVYLPTIL